MSQLQSLVTAIKQKGPKEKYKVTFHEIIEHVTEVEALDREDAADLAWENKNNGINLRSNQYNDEIIDIEIM